MKVDSDSKKLQAAARLAVALYEARAYSRQVQVYFLSVMEPGIMKVPHAPINQKQELRFDHLQCREMTASGT